MRPLIPAVMVAAVAATVLASCSPEEEGQSSAEAVSEAQVGRQGAASADALLEEATQAANLGRDSEAAENFGRAADLFEAAGDRAGMGRVLLARGSLAHHTGQIEVARGHYARASEEFGAAGDRVGEGRVALAVGELERSRFNNPEALAAFRQAETRFREVGEWRLEAEALVGVGDNERRLRNIMRSRDALGRARAIFDALGDVQGARLALQVWDELLTYFDEFDEARQRHERDLDEATHADDPIRQAKAGLALARIDVGAGRPEAARRAFATVNGLLADSGDKIVAGETWWNLAELERRLANNSAAATAYGDSQAAYRGASAPEGEALALIGLADVETVQDMDAQARYQAARALLPAGQSARVDGRLLVARGRLARRENQDESAADAFTRAHSVFSEAGLATDAAEALLARAELERDAGRMSDSLALYGDALSEFTVARDRIGEAEAREGLAATLAAASGATMEARVQYHLASAIFQELGRTERAESAKAAASALSQP